MAPDTAAGGNAQSRVHVCETPHGCARIDTRWVSVQGKNYQPGVIGFFCPQHDPARPPDAARPWVITDDDGEILARFATDEEARDALDAGDYDHIDTHFGTQIAYVNE